MSPTRTAHSAVHGLAMRTRCRCPDCGSRPRRARFEEDAFDEDGFDDFGDDFGDDFDEEDEFDEDADYAIRRAAATVRRTAAAAVARVRAAARTAVRRVASPAARPAARRAVRRAAATARAPRARRPFPQPAPLTPAQRTALNSTVRAFGWTGFRPPPAARPVTMQTLADFQRAGGVAQVGARQRLQITPEGRRLLQSNPAFRQLAPLFERGGQQVYEIAPVGQLDRPNYVGKTGRTPGERLLEHLQFGRDRAHAELLAAQRAGRLDQLQVAQGRFTAPDLGRRSHLGEVALMELTNPDWNDPRRHGFEEAAAF